MIGNGLLLETRWGGDNRGGMDAVFCGGGPRQAARMRRGQSPGAILCGPLSHFRPREEENTSGGRCSWGVGELRTEAAGLAGSPLALSGEAATCFFPAARSCVGLQRLRPSPPRRPARR